jgi:oxygen-independent coproporphyrinogen-3 oxidase
MQKPIPLIDIDFLKKYDTAGPRYTSYPPAPIFTSEYNEKLFEIDVIKNNDENYDPLSLYIHIPFCDTLCYFCGCTTVVTNNRNHITRYISVLKKEIENVLPYFNKHRRIVQLHFGGGTPSYLAPKEIEDVFSFLNTRFRFATDAEISVEIDPRGLTMEHLEAFRAGGVNRISLGVQDFDEHVQQAVNRIQPEEMTTQVITWAHQLGINSINVDLIYGLPLQTQEQFLKTLEKIIHHTPNRIAVFNFAYVPWMKPHQKLIHAEDLPSAETKLALLKTTIEQLTGAGYEYVGMDHFAKPEDELVRARNERTLHRNFQGYSTKANADMYAFGMSSISHFGNTYAQNFKTLQEYYDAVEQGTFPICVGYRMTRDDIIRKYAIMRLMCDLILDKQEVEERFGISFNEYFAESLVLLEEYAEAELVEINEEELRVVGMGRFVLRNIAMAFDAYLKKETAGKKLYSRTI